MRVARAAAGADGRPGAVTRLEVRGHAGFAAKGDDIVCAAASAIAYTAAGALRELAGLEGAHSEDAKAVEFVISIPVERWQEIGDRAALVAQVVLETAVIGYRQIAASYPDYLTVTESGAAD